MVMDPQHQEVHSSASVLQQHQSGRHGGDRQTSAAAPVVSVSAAAVAGEAGAPSPQSVGREFVRQYYTLLHQAPLHLHRFYSQNSSFVHGGLENGGDPEPVKGQQEIHQKIMQLNFRDCHAKIRQVDAHSTLGNGVVVQVSGELSNAGQAMRRFLQTFVLAPQSPKKYYVHNDIFRYQDEVFSEDESSGQPAAAGQTAAVPATLGASVVHPNVVSPSRSSQNVAGGTSFGEDSPTGPENVSLVRPVPVTGQQQQQHTTNGDRGEKLGLQQHSQHAARDPPTGFHHSVGLPEEMPVVGDAVRAAISLATGKGPEEDQVTFVHEQAATKSVPFAGVAHSPPQREEDSEVVELDHHLEGQPKPEATATDNGKTAPTETLTYANLVKSNSGTKAAVGGIQRPPEQTTSVPFSTSKYRGGAAKGGGGGGGQGRGGASSGGSARERHGSNKEGWEASPAPGDGGGNITERRRTQGSHSGYYSGGAAPGYGPAAVGGGGSSAPGGGQQQQHYSDGQQLFVGNLPHDCTEEQLEKLFSQFGRVADIRINNKGAHLTKLTPTGTRVPNFGFVVFEDEGGVAKCLQHLPILLPPNDHRLNVEEKKTRQARPDSYSGGGNSNNRGGFERETQEPLTGATGSQGGRGAGRDFPGGGGGGGSNGMGRGGDGGGWYDRGRGGSSMMRGGRGGSQNVTGASATTGQSGQTYRKRSPFPQNN